MAPGHRQCQAAGISLAQAARRTSVALHPDTAAEQASVVTSLPSPSPIRRERLYPRDAMHIRDCSLATAPTHCTSLIG